MAAKSKPRTACNSYNLRCKVEIPIEVQLNNDNTFFNEFPPNWNRGILNDERSVNF